MGTLTRATRCAVLLVAACGASRSSRPNDAGDNPQDSGNAVDSGPADASTDSGSDAGTLHDAGRADSGTDAGSDAGDPNIYPCEADADCLEWWWDGAAFCLKGFCCLGGDVGGECTCGSRSRTCPPDFEACCPTAGGEDTCVEDINDCSWGGL